MATGFTGTYDGNGYKVSGLTITNTTAPYIGLFGVIGDGATWSAGTVKNLRIVGANVNVTYNYAGIFAGYNNGGTIQQCYTTGTITSSASYLGGFVGANAGSISYCFTMAMVNGSASATQNAGGFAGAQLNFTSQTPVIQNCYAYSGLYYITEFTNAYPTVSGYSNIGGFIGYRSSNSSIANCYANFRVKGTTLQTGGFTGFVETGTGTTTNCFWDINTSIQPFSAGAELGKTTAEMKSQATYAGWDFSTTPVWKIATTYNDGYPYFAYQSYAPSFTTPDASPYYFIDYNPYYYPNTTARVSIDINDLGGQNITERGVYWSTTNGFADGDGTKVSYTSLYRRGLFYIIIEDLSPNTTYYAKAYATNPAGTSYGTQVSFTTTSHTTAGATNISGTDATLNGTLTTNDASSVVSFEYGTSTSYGSEVTANESATTATSVSYSLTGLTPNTSYHYRVKKVDAYGTGYGQDATFTTLQAATPPAAGDGSRFNPYQIATLENLAWLSQTQSVWGADTYFKQTADIDASATATWYGGKGFLPIGIYNEFYVYGDDIYILAFQGSYNGNGHTISGLTINRPDEQCVGLFGCTYRPDIQNLSITNATITGYKNVGGLIGLNGESDANINNCYSSGTVSGYTTVGGLIGVSGSLSISNCHSTARVSGFGYNYAEEVAFGGLIGSLPVSFSHSEVRNCYSTGAVSGYNQVGGLIGYCEFIWLYNSFSTGKVSGNSHVGGFIGTNGGATKPIDCYSTGNVRGNNNLGGFSGANEFGGFPENCYSTGTVTGAVGSAYIHGFTGYTNSVNPSYRPAIKNCFWNIETSGQSIGFVDKRDPQTVGSLTSAAMKVQSNYTDWEFSNQFWAINAAQNNGIPYFSWQTMYFATLESAAITTYNASSATVGGSISHDGNTPVLERGVLYSSTKTVPTMDGIGVSQKVIGSGTGAFSESISGLLPNTTYYAVAYATNAIGTSYGAVVTFTTLAVTSVAINEANYKTGDNLNITVNFSGNITVTGTPYIPITLNIGGTVNASYSSGSGTNALVFTYTVASGNIDDDGITVGDAISANGGTLQNSEGIDANLNLNNVANTAGVKVDGVEPTVFSVSSTTANGTYKLGDVIAITIAFSEPVTATGIPTLALNSGGSASYSSGSGTATLTFNYTVGSAQSSADLDYMATTSLALVGGTIKDIAGNNAVLTLPAVGSASSLGGQKNIVIALLPTVTTQAVSSVTATTATGNATISNLGYPNPTAYGVCWNTTGTPTTSDNVSASGATSTAGAFAQNITGLTPNTTYHVRGYAVNNAGTAYGNSVSFTTVAVMPTATTGAAGSISGTTATLNASVNAHNASTVVTFEYGTTTGYGSTASATPSPVTGISATSVSCLLTGLIPNTTYHFRVKGVNTAGTSNGNDATFTTPAIVPTATTGAAGSISSTAATLNATINANNASTVVTFEYGTTTGYGSTATAAPSPVTGTASTSVSCSLTGLTPYTTYHFRVKGVNTAGTSNGNDASFTTLDVVPGAPTIGTATRGNTQATVNFTAPASNGGSAITSYTVTSSPGGLTGTGITNPIIVSGLTNGTAYTFTVKATNAAGTSAASAASNSVIPATVPGAPTIGTATSGNAQATVTFTAPASNGGNAITGYTVTSSPSGITSTGTVSPIVVGGLTNGTAYTFTVTATNAIGTSAASAASNSVTPATVPGAPTSVNAVAGNTQASVNFSAPASNGGSVITGYTVTSIPGGFTASGTASPIIVSGLTNGTVYTFTVRATNAIGTGAASAASTAATPAAVPGVPTSINAVAGNAQATVSFNAPASSGGSAITGYTVTSSPGGLTGTGTTSPITVLGLTNGTAYTFTVTATSAIGTGLSSSASNSVTPVTIPDAPTSVSAIAGNTQVTVSFTAPASSGGSTITSYTVTSSPDGLTGTGSSSPIIVSGLTNGTAYTFTVTATNAVGTGAASAVSTSVTPATVPGMPTSVSAIADNAQATVSFTALASNGGSAITGYTVISNPGGLTGTGSSSPIIVSGLTNGTDYSFTVTATNAVGTGLPSDASNSVTPVTIPDAPTIGTVTGGNAQATVTFTAPASDGGSAITGYTVISNPGGLTGTGSSSPIIVSGLTNGTAHTFTVTATNAVGTSAASAASNSVTPATVPGTPTSVTAVAGNTLATVNFTVPASDGGSAITSYTVTSNPDGIAVTGTTSPIVISGLTNGTAYTFMVTATNAVGTSDASAASNLVTPALITAPGAPTIGRATAGNGQAVVTFTAPASDGGSAITSYTVTSSPGGLTGTGTSSPVTVTGLTNGTAYTFTITATNGIGTSAASATSNSVIPITVPGVPASISAVAGNTQATISFIAPASDGGSAITGYTVTSIPGGLTATGTSSPITVTGLTNGTAYTFTVTATNAAGSGESSGASNSVTPSTNTAVDNIQSKSVSLYPNPVTDGFFVTLGEDALQSETLTCTILDMNGKTMMQKTINAGTFVPVSNLAAGVYLVEICMDGRKEIKRIVVE